MTFAEWLLMVERSGAPVNGIDSNWLQYQYQSQQQPALVAQAILSGQAPRSFAQSMYQRPIKQKGAGCGTFGSILFGLIGFVAIIGGILYGLSYVSKQNETKIKQNRDPNMMTYEEKAALDKMLISKGLNPELNFPYWPLVYDPGMSASKDAIRGKVKNYGDNTVNKISIFFGLFAENGDKVGSAQDSVDSLGPGQTWTYKADVKNEYYKCQLENIVFVKD